MRTRKRFYYLLIIMIVIVLIVSLSTILLLYNVGLEQQEDRLVNTAKSRARMIEAIATFDQEYTTFPEGARNATLKQVNEAHKNFKGFGETGEFTLAEKKNGWIIFNLSYRHEESEVPENVSLLSENAEPMRRALDGESGTIIGLDYRGETVLAAYEPVEVLEMGIVVKIDLQEVREPYIEAAIVAVSIALILVAIGTVLFIHVSNPLFAELEKSEAMFRGTFDQVAVGLAHADLGGGFTHVNQRFSDITMYPVDELLDMTFLEITHPDDLESSMHYLEEMLGSDIDGFSSETRMVRKDGSLVWVDLTVSLFEDDKGDRVFFVGVIQDITPRKAAEAEVKVHTEELERSNEELERFAYIASHDLQEPLRTITSYVQLIEMRYKDQLDDEAVEFIGYVVEGTSRMQEKMTDLLTYSRIGTGESQIVPVDLNITIDEVTKTFNASIKQTDAIIRYDKLPTVMANPVHMEQLIQNLIGNALKFHGDSPPEITIDARRAVGGWIISVADNGIGLESRYNDQVFDIFKRLHRVTEYEGTGIGLAICKKIVRTRGGHIWYESEPGQGTTFFFSIPDERNVGPVRLEAP